MGTHQDGCGEGGGTGGGKGGDGGGGLGGGGVGGGEGGGGGGAGGGEGSDGEGGGSEGEGAHAVWVRAAARPVAVRVWADVLVICHRGVDQRSSVIIMRPITQGPSQIINRSSRHI